MKDKYLIAPHDTTDEQIEFAEKYYVGYKIVRAEMMPVIDKKPKLNWRENLKSNGVKV